MESVANHTLSLWLRGVVWRKASTFRITSITIAEGWFGPNVSVIQRFHFNRPEYLIMGEHTGSEQGTKFSGSISHDGMKCICTH